MNVLIFNPLHIHYDETSVETGALGGSETWSVQIADELQSLGIKCFNVCSCGRSHVSKTGVVYVDKSDIQAVVRMKFDFAICYRLMSLFYSLLNRFDFTDAFALMLSDTSCPDFVHASLNDPRLKRVIVLSPWHKQHIKNMYSLKDGMISVIPNGVDLCMFSSLPADKECDHSILWSSRAERGLSILSEDIAPIVRKSIPDFKVLCTQYADNPHFDYNRLNVQCVGPLSKKKLYAEMHKHGVWFYPSTFDETFCITAIENMMCSNTVVMHLQYGTLQYEGVAIQVHHNFSNEDEYQTACNEAAELISYCIANFGSQEMREQRARARDLVMQNFTWRTAAMKLIQLIEESKR